jgi:hypothetical protein
MKRIGLVTLAAVALGTVTSPATTVGPLSIAPFAQTTALAGGMIGNPCISLASPVPARSPDWKTGRIDGSLGVAVANCSVSTKGETNNWKIADSPADLVGKKATVALMIFVDGVEAVQTGTASRSASYKLKVGDKEWTVVSIACEDLSCHHEGNDLGPVMFPLGITYDVLPATIELSILREARIEALPGETVSGSVGVDVRATLQAVLIRAAD